MNTHNCVLLLLSLLTLFCGPHCLVSSAQQPAVVSLLTGETKEVNCNGGGIAGSSVAKLIFTGALHPGNYLLIENCHLPFGLEMKAVFHPGSGFTLRNVVIGPASSANTGGGGAATSDATTVLNITTDESLLSSSGNNNNCSGAAHANTLAGAAVNITLDNIKGKLNSILIAPAACTTGMQLSSNTLFPFNFILRDITNSGDSTMTGTDDDTVFVVDDMSATRRANGDEDDQKYFFRGAPVAAIHIAPWTSDGGFDGALGSDQHRATIGAMIVERVAARTHPTCSGGAEGHQETSAFSIGPMGAKRMLYTFYRAGVDPYLWTQPWLASGSPMPSNFEFREQEGTTADALVRFRKNVFVESMSNIKKTSTGCIDDGVPPRNVLMSSVYVVNVILRVSSNHRGAGQQQQQHQNAKRLMDFSENAVTCFSAQACVLLNISQEGGEDAASARPSLPSLPDSSRINFHLKAQDNNVTSLPGGPQMKTGLFVVLGVRVPVAAASTAEIDNNILNVQHNCRYITKTTQTRTYGCARQTNSPLSMTALLVVVQRYSLLNRISVTRNRALTRRGAKNIGILITFEDTFDMRAKSRVSRGQLDDSIDRAPSDVPILAQINDGLTVTDNVVDVDLEIPADTIDDGRANNGYYWRGHTNITSKLEPSGIFLDFSFFHLRVNGGETLFARNDVSLRFAANNHRSGTGVKLNLYRLQAGSLVVDGGTMFAAPRPFAAFCGESYQKCGAVTVALRVNLAAEDDDGAPATTTTISTSTADPSSPLQPSSSQLILRNLQLSVYSEADSGHGLYINALNVRSVRVLNHSHNSTTIGGGGHGVRILGMKNCGEFLIDGARCHVAASASSDFFSAFSGALYANSVAIRNINATLDVPRNAGLTSFERTDFHTIDLRSRFMNTAVLVEHVKLHCVAKLCVGVIVTTYGVAALRVSHMFMNSSTALSSAGLLVAVVSSSSTGGTAAQELQRTTFDKPILFERSRLILRDPNVMAGVMFGIIKFDVQAGDFDRTFDVFSNSKITIANVTLRDIIMDTEAEISDPILKLAKYESPYMLFNLMSNSACVAFNVPIANVTFDHVTCSTCGPSTYLTVGPKRSTFKGGGPCSSFFGRKILSQAQATADERNVARFNFPAKNAFSDEVIFEVCDGVRTRTVSRADDEDDDQQHTPNQSVHQETTTPVFDPQSGENKKTTWVAQVAADSILAVSGASAALSATPIGAAGFARMRSVLGVMTNLADGTCDDGDRNSKEEKAPSVAESPTQMYLGPRAEYSGGMAVGNLLISFGFFLMFIVAYLLHKKMSCCSSCSGTSSLQQEEDEDNDAALPKTFREIVARSHGSGVVVFAILMFLAPTLTASLMLVVRANPTTTWKVIGVILFLIIFCSSVAFIYVYLYRRRIVERYKPVNTHITAVAAGSSASSSGCVAAMKRCMVTLANLVLTFVGPQGEWVLLNTTSSATSERDNSSRNSRRFNANNFLGSSTRSQQQVVTEDDKINLELALPLLESFNDRAPRFFAVEVFVQVGLAIGPILAAAIEGFPGCVAHAVCVMLVLGIYLVLLLRFRPHVDLLSRIATPATTVVECISLVIALSGVTIDVIAGLLVALSSLQLVLSIAAFAFWFLAFGWPIMQRCIRHISRNKNNNSDNNNASLRDGRRRTASGRREGRSSSSPAASRSSSSAGSRREGGGSSRNRPTTTTSTSHPSRQQEQALRSSSTTPRRRNLNDGRFLPHEDSRAFNNSNNNNMYIQELEEQLLAVSGPRHRGHHETTNDYPRSQHSPRSTSEHRIVSHPDERRNSNPPPPSHLSSQRSARGGDRHQHEPQQHQQSSSSSRRSGSQLRGSSSSSSMLRDFHRNSDNNRRDRDDDETGGTEMAAIVVPTARSPRTATGSPSSSSHAARPSSSGRLSAANVVPDHHASASSSSSSSRRRQHQQERQDDHSSTPSSSALGSRGRRDDEPSRRQPNTNTASSQPSSSASARMSRYREAIL